MVVTDVTPAKSHRGAQKERASALRSSHLGGTWFCFKADEDQVGKQMYMSS
jgi:hypothetical protein